MSAPAHSYVDIPVASLLGIINPFVTPPWHCSPFTEEDVLEAVEEGRFQSEPVPNYYPRKDHIERVAYLVEEGWDLTQDLPHLDVGVPGFSVPEWPLEDGNHRFCAALVRGDRFFRVVLSGSLKYAEELLGIAIEMDD